MPKILVIDDSAFMRQYIRGFLEDAGFEVEDLLPGSALEALEAIRNAKPDLLLSDYNMPNLDGQSVARMARRADPKLPVVILTAARDVDREAKLKELGACAVLYKPLKGEELVTQLRKVLGL